VSIVVPDEGMRVVRSADDLPDGPFQVWSLFLVGCKTTDDGMAHLEAMPELQQLSVNGSTTGDAGLCHIEALKGLRYLDLAGVTASDAALARVCALSNLQTLNLSYTHVTDATVGVLKSLPNLENLEINSPNIHLDVALAHLKSARRLRSLYLAGAPVSD